MFNSGINHYIITLTLYWLFGYVPRLLYGYATINVTLREDVWFFIVYKRYIHCISIPYIAIIKINL